MISKASLTKNLTSLGRKISIVAPVYNESDSIIFFYGSLCKLFDQIPDFTFEVIFIDDGSLDDTLQKIISISEEDSRFQVIELSRNFGKEAALTAGIDASIGDAVIPIDVDLQDPPDLIVDMIGEWLKGAEIVLAKRVNRSSDSFLKRNSANIFYWAHNCLSSVKIPNNVGDFRLMDRVVIDAIKTIPERQRFMKGLFSWVGFSTVTIEYVRNPRIAGATKFSGWKLWNFALEGITSFSALPLRIWTYIGLFGAISTIIYAGYIILKTLILGIEVPGYASIIVAILFFGSLQLISIGVLGEYIGRIYMEAKGRPLYLIRRRYCHSK